MNNTYPPVGDPPEGIGVLISADQADRFRSTLKNLPHQDKSAKRRKPKDNTLKSIVAQFYPYLEQARTERNYSYSQLANLFREYLGCTIATETLRKYMDDIRKGKQPLEGKPQSPIPKPPITNNHQGFQPPTSPAHQNIQQTKSGNPPTPLPSHLTADPSEFVRKTRTYQ